MYAYFVIIINEDGEMQDAREHRWESSAVEDGQEYADLYPKSHIGIFWGTKNIAQFIPSQGWWIIKAGKWHKAEPEYLLIENPPCPDDFAKKVKG